jgi:hypothetical protein
VPDRAGRSFASWGAVFKVYFEACSTLNSEETLRGKNETKEHVTNLAGKKSRES